MTNASPHAAPQTLPQKVWDRHVVHRAEGELHSFPHELFRSFTFYKHSISPQEDTAIEFGRSVRCARYRLKTFK